MSQFATKFKHRQHTENITDDDEFPISLDIRKHQCDVRHSSNVCMFNRLLLSNHTLQHEDKLHRRI